MLGPSAIHLRLKRIFQIYICSFRHTDLLKKHVAKGLKLANISDASKDYIFNLIEVEMTKSYFKEPGGIFFNFDGIFNGGPRSS